MVSLSSRTLQKAGLTLVVGFLAGSQLWAQTPNLKVVQTAIDLDYKAHLAISDSLLAYGVGNLKGVGYLRPGETQGQTVPDSEQFSSKSFAVCAQKIALINPQDFSLTVFDTQSKRSSPIPLSEVKVRSIGGSLYHGGGIQGAGNYLAALLDPNESGGHVLALIDVSSDPPVVKRFPRWSQSAYLRQVAVNEQGTVVVASQEQVAIYTPQSSEPTFIDLAEGVSSEQISLKGDTLAYFTDKGRKAATLDLKSKTPRVFALNPAISDLDLQGQTVAYFVKRDAKDAHSNLARLAIGKIDGTSSVSLATGNFVDGKTRNNGLIGFGSSVAICGDGTIFLAGKESIGRSDRLQVVRDGKISLFPDATVKPAFLQASDVIASGRWVAFKTGSNNKTRLSYIQL